MRRRVCHDGFCAMPGRAQGCDWTWSANRFGKEQSTAQHADRQAGSTKCLRPWGVCDWRGQALKVGGQVATKGKERRATCQRCSAESTGCTVPWGGSFVRLSVFATAVRVRVKGWRTVFVLPESSGLRGEVPSVRRSARDNGGPDWLFEHGLLASRKTLKKWRGECSEESGSLSRVC